MNHRSSDSQPSAKPLNARKLSSKRQPLSKVRTGFSTATPESGAEGQYLGGGIRRKVVPARTSQPTGKVQKTLSSSSEFAIIGPAKKWRVARPYPPYSVLAASL